MVRLYNPTDSAQETDLLFGERPVEAAWICNLNEERLEEVPLLTSTGGLHRGELLGFKGKFAVYREEVGQVRAVNLSDSVARSIIPSDSSLR